MEVIVVLLAKPIITSKGYRQNRGGGAQLNIYYQGGWGGHSRGRSFEGGGGVALLRKYGMFQQFMIKIFVFNQGPFGKALIYLFLKFIKS